MILTTSDLVTAVRRKGQIPDGSDYSDTEILAEADEVISGRMTEAVAGLSNGYFVRSVDVTVTAGTARYAMPTRAVADTVESVSWVESAYEIPLSRQRKSDVAYSHGSSGSPYNYVIDGSDLVLLPTPQSSGTIRVRYMLRRSRLTSIGTNAFAITSINTGARTVSFTGTVPAAWTAYATVDAFIDFVSATDYTHRAVDSQVTGTSQVGPVGTVEADGQALPSDLVVGDHVTTSGYTAIVQLPVELHGALSNATAASILFQRGFDSTAQRLDAMAARDIALYQRMAAERAKRDPIRMVNRGSMLRMRG